MDESRFVPSILLKMKNIVDRKALNGEENAQSIPYVEDGAAFFLCQNNAPRTGCGRKDFVRTSSYRPTLCRKSTVDKPSSRR